MIDNVIGNRSSPTLQLLLKDESADSTEKVNQQCQQIFEAINRQKYSKSQLNTDLTLLNRYLAQVKTKQSNIDNLINAQQVFEAIEKHSLREDCGDITIRPGFSFVEAGIPEISYRVYFTEERMAEEKAKKVAASCLKISLVVLALLALYYVNRS